MDTLNWPVRIYTPGRREAGTVRVKCLAQEHSTMSLARARTRTTRFGDKHTSHEANMPPRVQFCSQGKIVIFFIPLQII